MKARGCLILIVAISVLYVNSVKCQVVEDGLISYWSFDAPDVKGNTVIDLVGGNDGTTVGALKHVKGKIGQAFEFGGDPDVIDVESPTNCSLDFGDDQDFSMMAWIKVD